MTILNRPISPVVAILFLICLGSNANAQGQSFPELHGDYLGLKPAADSAAVFAKGIISTDDYEHSAPAFSPDGNIVIWGIVERDKPSRLLEIRRVNNTWTKPAPVSFSALGNDDMYPAFSTDGSKVFFSSRRPLPSGGPVNDMRLWVVARAGSGWGEPQPLDLPVSAGYEYAHSVSKYGNLFFSTRQVSDAGVKWNINCAAWDNGKFQAPVKLKSAINDGSYVDGPFVSPDETFLVFESDRPGGFGSNDLYICFKQKDGSWGKPKNMGKAVNSGFSERFAGISPDGKCFFFSSNRNTATPDIFWLDASFIEKIKADDN